MRSLVEWSITQVQSPLGNSDRLSFGELKKSLLQMTAAVKLKTLVLEEKL